MYIHQLSVRRLRSIDALKANFAYDGQVYGPASGMAPPRLPNVNVILGGNGTGKSSFLQAVALAVLGPQAGTTAQPMVRATPGRSRSGPDEARIEAIFTAAPRTATRDRAAPIHAESGLRIVRHAGTERLHGLTRDAGEVGAAANGAGRNGGFAVGYGANRRVGPSAPAAGKAAPEADRPFGSLLDEPAVLVPLESWLPGLQRQRARTLEIGDLLNRLLAPLHGVFTGRRDRTGAYLFEDPQGLALPLSALSEGLRGFIGWAADLLYHLHAACPRGTPLAAQAGIALIDEVDLHLHPSSQRQLVPTLAAALPRVQFILSTHSPLVVGGLDIANILVLRRTGDAVQAVRLDRPVYGLDADQLLVSGLFALPSSRAQPQSDALKRLATRARAGDMAAALRFLDALAPGQQGSAR